MDPNFSFSEKTEGFCGRSREIDERRFAFAGQVVDAHVDLSAVGGIDHFEPAVQGEIPGGGGQLLRIIALAGIGAATVEAFRVVRGMSLVVSGWGCVGRRYRCDWCRGNG